MKNRWFLIRFVVFNSTLVFSVVWNQYFNLYFNYTEPQSPKSGGKYGNGFLQIKYGFTKNEEGCFPKTWLILVILPTSSIGNNNDLVSII